MPLLVTYLFWFFEFDTFKVKTLFYDFNRKFVKIRVLNSVVTKCVNSYGCESRLIVHIRGLMYLTERAMN